MFTQDPNSPAVQSLTARIEALTGRADQIGLCIKPGITGKLRCTAYVQGDSLDEDEPEFEGWGGTWVQALAGLAEHFGVDDRLHENSIPVEEKA